MIERFIKTNFISGLGDVVVQEITTHPNLSIAYRFDDCIYLTNDSDIATILGLRSITNAFLVKRDHIIHPTYLANHKSVLMELVEEVIVRNNKKITSFKISCAGDDSDEIKSIKRYIIEQYKLDEDPYDADLKIYIGKHTNEWEIGVELTTRPLSVRDYKVGHIRGGMNPTIAYAMNILCDISHSQSYLNAFSGGATLLIEAAQINPNLKLVGFDNDKHHISQAIKNITAAKLLRSIQIKYLDIFNNPDLGTFDTIVADLPFGMNISKGENLEKMYQTFIHFCERSLSPHGTVGIYTTEFETLEPILATSPFITTKTLLLKSITSADSFIYPKLFICKFKK